MVAQRASPLGWFSLGILALSGACAKTPARGTFTTTTDDWGRTVALAAPARRIVSLAPATTEVVFALGLGDRLVGRTTWCDYPPAARAVPDVGNGIGPSVELVAAQRPDLVVLYASEANRPALARLEALGIPTAVLRLDLVHDLERAARLIGELAGEPLAAQRLLSAFDRELEGARRPAVLAAARPGQPHRVYIDVEANPPITIGRGSYLSQIVAGAGAVNVFADIAAPSAPVSLEAIAERDPDAILVMTADTTRAPDLGRRPGWRAIRAVRERRYLVVDAGLYGRPSFRMPRAVRDLARRLERFGTPR